MSAGAVAASYVDAAPGYQGAVLADSPLLYYRLNETSGTTCMDTSGNARNGTYSGGYTLGITGAITSDPTNKAVNFTGASGKMDVPYGAYMDAASITVETWVLSTITGQGPLWDRDKGNGTTSPRVWQFRLSNSKVEFIRIGGTGGTITATSVKSVNDGNWHHVAATYDGSNIRIYIDGALDKTVSAPGAFSGHPAAMSLAVNDASVGAVYLNGVLDEAAYYGTALSGARILAHYNAR